MQAQESYHSLRKDRNAEVIRFLSGTRGPVGGGRGGGVSLGSDSRTAALDTVRRYSGSSAQALIQPMSTGVSIRSEMEVNPFRSVKSTVATSFWERSRPPAMNSSRCCQVASATSGDTCKARRPDSGPPVLYCASILSGVRNADGSDYRLAGRRHAEHLLVRGLPQ